jgi:hypothetical protein
MSALPLKADMLSIEINVRYVPEADIAVATPSDLQCVPDGRSADGAPPGSRLYGCVLAVTSQFDVVVFDIRFRKQRLAIVI